MVIDTGYTQQEGEGATATAIEIGAGPADPNARGPAWDLLEALAPAVH